MADTQLNISYHSITDKGGRAVNEDSLGILPTKDALYFLLCDGLGGHGSGDIASLFVVEQMKANLEKGISVEESITRTQQALLEKQKKEDATDKMNDIDLSYDKQFRCEFRSRRRLPHLLF